MDNFNENSLIPEEPEMQESLGNSEPAQETLPEPGPEITVDEDVVGTATDSVNKNETTETKNLPSEDFSLYEPEPGKHRKNKKEKKPLTWKRVTWGMIGIGVAAFLAGILFATQLLFPIYQSLVYLDSENGNTIYQPENSEENDGVQKEREEFSAHPDQLPNLGGEAPVITNQQNPVPEIVEQLSDGIVLVMTSTTTQYADGTEESNEIAGGTGFIISADGYIVTNNHVIAKGTDFVVTLPSGKEYSAALVGTDTETDLAVLKIEPKETLTVLPIGNSDEVKTGELAIAVGNASGAGETLTGTVTVGYISAVNRELTFNGTKQLFLQTDAALNSGNSGGPLINSQGVVIGISTLKSLISSYMDDGTTVSSEGIGFAIPINRAMEKIQQIILTGSITKAGIGLTYLEVTEEDAKEFGLPRGLMVVEFMENSPALKAGIESDDIIVKIDDILIENVENISDYIVKKGIGEKIKLTVFRGDEYLDFEVEIQDINSIR